MEQWIYCIIIIFALVKGTGVTGKGECPIYHWICLRINMRTWPCVLAWPHIIRVIICVFPIGSLGSGALHPPPPPAPCLAAIVQQCPLPSFSCNSRSPLQRRLCLVPSNRPIHIYWTSEYISDSLTWFSIWSYGTRSLKAPLLFFF